MSISYRQLRKCALTCALLSLCFLPLTSPAQDQTTGANSSSTAPDNTAKNKAHRKTADQQAENSSDRETTKKIRSAIVADKSISTYGHNIKIITVDGMVTLKGPVHSAEEKQAIASKAAEVAGGEDKVTNQLTVKKQHHANSTGAHNSDSPSAQ